MTATTIETTKNEQRRSERSRVSSSSSLRRVACGECSEAAFLFLRYPLLNWLLRRLPHASRRRADRRRRNTGALELRTNCATWRGAALRRAPSTRAICNRVAWSGAGCEKVGTGVAHRSRSDVLEPITFMPLEVLRSKGVVVAGGGEPCAAKRVANRRAGATAISGRVRGGKLESTRKANGGVNA